MGGAGPLAGVPSSVVAGCLGVFDGMGIVAPSPGNLGLCSQATLPSGSQDAAKQVMSRDFLLLLARGGK
jgi:hypothetical protein